jgi:hypothetical protein
VLSKTERKYLKDSYILFLIRTYIYIYIYIYNSLIVSLQLFADTDNPDDLQNKFHADQEGYVNFFKLTHQLQSKMHSFNM